MPRFKDIPELTRVGGHARLPAQPDVVAELFRVACRQGIGRPMAELVGHAEVRTGASRPRLEGLAAWLPLSHVARWERGLLALHPGTSPIDLACRYAAWAGSQPVPADAVTEVTAYARAIVEAAAGDDTSVGRDGRWERPDGPERTPHDRSGDPLTERLGRLLASLDASFLERAVQVRMVLLAVLSGRHALLLGPPGTAKSQLARAIADSFVDCARFEYLLTRFTHPDELFGPVSIPGLKDEDYRRLTEGFLPVAQVAFLDEIFKANSAILNSLLTLINERVFHHGRHRDQVPLLGLIGASNELPEPGGGLDALYDRFAVRLTVPPLEQAASFLTVATGEVPEVQTPDDARLTPSDVLQLRSRAERVAVPDAVRGALVAVWERATEAAWGVSDRRWRHAVGLLKVAAAAEARTCLTLADLLLLTHVLPPDPSLAAEVEAALVEVVAPRAVPRHDLHAQWTLLRLDRVAPVGDGPIDRPPAPTWTARMERRRRHARRFTEHVRDAVARLAADRAQVEGGSGALWQAVLPARVLAAHIQEAGQLARVLTVAERYEVELSTERAAAEALLTRLPEATNRRFAGVAVRVHLTDVGVDVGLSLSGERVDQPAVPAPRAPAPETRQQGRLSRPASGGSFEADAWARSEVLEIEAGELVAYLRGELDLEVLLGRLRATVGRQAMAALQAMRRHLGDSGVPTPATLPI